MLNRSHSSKPRSTRTLASRVLGVLACAIATLPAQINQAPAMAQGVEITEKLGDKLPLELQFVNERGQAVRLGDFFGKGHPVIVTMNYANCPMLCKLQLKGFVDALKALRLTAGKDFSIVTVSLDTEETRARSVEVKKAYMLRWGDMNAAPAWHFLRAIPGQRDNVKTLADALGFGYRKDPKTGEYSHLACLMLASPDGVLTRYLYGVKFAESTLRLGLTEAGKGEIGSTLDKVLLWCFSYNSETGQYTPVAWRLLRIGAILTIAFLAVLIFGFRKRSGPGPKRPVEATA